jgi:biopolymer transport protein ExbB/TolQ
VVVTVLAFLVLNWIIALFIAIMGLTLVVVGALASSWDDHSTFEQRELDRARKRAVKRERNAGARAKDRARWEAHQARQATKEADRPD